MATSKRTSLLKITDFGLSKNRTVDMKSFVGTMSYMAPEVIMAKRTANFVSYTNKADIWSLGCILFSLLSGLPAFTGDSSFALEESILNGEAKMRGAQWGSISEDAKDLVRHLLVVDPKRRLSSEKALQHRW